MSKDQITQTTIPLRYRTTLFVTISFLLAIVFTEPAGAHVRIINQELNGGSLLLDDDSGSLVSDSRLTDVHLVLFSSDLTAFIGLQIDGSSYITLDGKDYKTVGEITTVMDILMSNRKFTVAGCIWHKDGNMMSFGKPL